jgi:hypothetical protein
VTPKIDMAFIADYDQKKVRYRVEDLGRWCVRGTLLDWKAFRDDEKVMMMARGIVPLTFKSGDYTETRNGILGRLDEAAATYRIIGEPVSDRLLFIIAEGPAVTVTEGVASDETNSRKS